MNACVLIPHKLSLVLQIPSHSDNNFNVNGEVWANTLLVPGAVFKPDEGELRLDRLDNCHVLDDNDIRRQYGCYDVIVDVDGQPIRHCNWLRFVTLVNDPQDANLITSTFNGDYIFLVTKFVNPNEKMLMFLLYDKNNINFQNLKYENTNLISMIYSRNVCNKTSIKTKSTQMRTTKDVFETVTSLSSLPEDNGSSSATDISMNSTSSGLASSTPISNTSSTFDHTGNGDSSGVSDVDHKHETDTATNQLTVSNNNIDADGNKCFYMNVQNCNSDEITYISPRGEKTIDSTQTLECINGAHVSWQDNMSMLDKYYDKNGSNICEMNETAKKSNSDTTTIKEVVFEEKYVRGALESSVEISCAKKAHSDVTTIDCCSPVINRKTVGKTVDGDVIEVCKYKESDQPSPTENSPHYLELPHPTTGTTYQDTSLQTSTDDVGHERMPLNEADDDKLILAGRSRGRTWVCTWDRCCKRFDRPSLLKRHLRTHTGEKPHGCDVCGKAFSTSSSLNTHRRIHSGEKPHRCEICGKSFTASSNLYYHRMTHKKDKPHKCTECSKSFPTPGDLRSHAFSHTGRWPFRCKDCNKGFCKLTNLKNHELLHTGEKLYACSKCDKRFSFSCNLKSHLRTHLDMTMQEKKTCANCDAVFEKGSTENGVLCQVCCSDEKSVNPASSGNFDKQRSHSPQSSSDSTLRNDFRLTTSALAASSVKMSTEGYASHRWMMTGGTAAARIALFSFPSSPFTSLPGVMENGVPLIASSHLPSLYDEKSSTLWPGYFSPTFFNGGGQSYPTNPKTDCPYPMTPCSRWKMSE